MVKLEDIKESLPNWPDEVIEQWLLKLANRGSDTGWPPPEDVEGHAWGAILGWRPLSWWKDVTWSLEEQDVGFDALCNGTRRIVNSMIDDVANGKALGDNGDARFHYAMDHLVKSAKFHKPLVVMKLKDGLSVIDGNHRVTALVACQATADEILKHGGKVPATKQQVWMGTHANGAVPLD